MLFKIRGTDGQGRKREISIDAPSEAEAVRRVKEMGITVGAAEALPDKAVGSHRGSYPAIAIYATVLRITGMITIVSGVAAGIGIVVLSNGDARFGIGFLVLVEGVVAGVGQLAFAELLGLFVRLQANTQYMCDLMHAFQQQQRSAKPSNPTR